MTLRQPNIERMFQLGLSGMAEALAEQRDVADIEARLRRPPLSFSATGTDFFSPNVTT